MSNMAPVHYRLLLLEILVASRLSQGELLQHGAAHCLQPQAYVVISQDGWCMFFP